MEENYKVGQKVEVTVERFTPLGAVVSFNNGEGLVYQSDIFEELKIGQKAIGYIKEVREDGKIDITFRKHGYKNFIGSTSDLIVKALKDNNGVLKLSDKSSSEEVQNTLGISKTQFKKAIGRLYKRRRILISETDITLK